PFDPAKKGGRYQPEFIWNTDWQKALEREESLQRKVDEARAKPKEADSGFLSFSRLSDLDSMDVDLSERLTKRRQADAAAREAAAARAASAPPPVPRVPRPRLPVVRPARKTSLPVFTRKEVARLDRVTRSSARNAPIVLVPELDAEKLRVAELERVRYEQVKVDQLVWTVAFSAAGVGMTYVSYTPSVAASYAVGAVAGFAYLRLLSKSVDSMGGAGAAAGMASQPRLLIPIILGLGYNRFNQLYSEPLGVTLELLPILVGFFTYKLAVVARQYKDVFDGL
ncbi:ATP synthase protein I, partial [Tetrabaena socialis]